MMGNTDFYYSIIDWPILLIITVVSEIMTHWELGSEIVYIALVQEVETTLQWCLSDAPTFLHSVHTHLKMACGFLLSMYTLL